MIMEECDMPHLTLHQLRKLFHSFDDYHLNSTLVEFSSSRFVPSLLLFSLSISSLFKPKRLFLRLLVVVCLLSCDSLGPHIGISSGSVLTSGKSLTSLICSDSSCSCSNDVVLGVHALLLFTLTFFF